MSKKAVELKLLNVRETALHLGIHENTVRNWVRDGTLRSARVPGSKFHRFDARDVERLLKDRGSAVSSVESERLLINPELIDATQLHQWAQTHGAKAKFPELVRRLLVATPGMTNISVRTGEGVALTGWDGRAESQGTSFLPKGMLLFEFSTDGNPNTKASDDFVKRQNDPLGEDSGNSVFVFITPRRWRDKDKWAAERRAANTFADVRALDADDLAGWLTATPAVHYWISEELGKRPQGAETLERWWTSFSAQTTPHLPHALFMAGRDEQRQRLIDFLNKAPDVIAVQAAWQNDALAFVSATIAGTEAQDTIPFPLVVKSPDVWDRVIHQPGRMTLLPLFEQPDTRTAIAHHHRVIVPLGRESKYPGENPIQLPQPHRSAACEALESAGVHFALSYQLAALARRSMPALVRTLNRDPQFTQPPWTQHQDAQVLAPLVLLGCWDPSVPGDREIVEQITDSEWKKVERTLNFWLPTNDPPFVRSGDYWRVACIEDAFLLLGDKLSDSDIVRWQQIAIDLLLEPDPAAELEPDKQPIAGILGVTRQHSAVLRRGVAEGLALVGSPANDDLKGSSLNADHASDIINDILTRANADEAGRSWRSLATELPLLAEGAPQIFLDKVHDNLNRTNPVLATMFTDNQRDSLFGSSPHTWLLWALETLCWSAETLIEATRALARLHKIDPGGRTANSPLNSLSDVLAGWVRHTSAPLELRIAALEAICGSIPETGWPLVLALWPKTHAVSSPPHAPRFHDWLPESNGMPIFEHIAHISHVVRLGLELAEGDVDRSAQLAGCLGPLPPAERNLVLDFLERLTDPAMLEHNQRLLLWDCLHSEISRHRRFSHTDWALDNETLNRLELIANRIEPTNNSELFGYLFDWHPDIPGVDIMDHQAYRQQLAQLRQDAVHAVLSQGSLEELRKLAERSPARSTLGSTLGEIATDDLVSDLVPWLDSEDPNLRETSSSWASCRLHKEGAMWLRKILAYAEMTPARRAAIVRGAPATREVWDALLEIDVNLHDLFWENINPWHIEPADTPYAAHQLLAHDRAWAAVDLLATESRRATDGQCHVTVKLTEEVLNAALHADPNAATSQSLGSEIGLLLDYLESQRVNAEKLASYEFGFFRLTEDYRQPRALFAAMSADASLFVDLVKQAYGGKNDPKRRLKAEAAAAADHAWWILERWRGLPGQREDGTIDSAQLTRWVRTARLAFDEINRTDIGDEKIGRVLAASPPGNDGVWPAEAVREILETIGSSSIETGMHIGRLNDRGTTVRGPYDGGQQESVLAAQYREWEKSTAGKWPRTSRLLRRLAENYEKDAKRMDKEAEISSDM